MGSLILNRMILIYIFLLIYVQDAKAVAISGKKDDFNIHIHFNTSGKQMADKRREVKEIGDTESKQNEASNKDSVSKTEEQNEHNRIIGGTEVYFGNRVLGPESEGNGILAVQESEGESKGNKSAESNMEEKSKNNETKGGTEVQIANRALVPESKEKKENSQVTDLEESNGEEDEVLNRFFSAEQCPNCPSCNICPPSSGGLGPVQCANCPYCAVCPQRRTPKKSSTWVCSEEQYMCRCGVYRRQPTDSNKCAVL